MRLRRRLLQIGAGLGALVLIAFTVPVTTVEALCRPSGQSPALDSTKDFGIIDPGYRRALTTSVMSYPEWYMVYAYQDFADTLRHEDEYRFGYWASVSEYWSGLCAVNRAAIVQGGGELDEKVTLYIIGVSFTAEMAAKGLYESTVGQLFAWIRGPEKTNEDRFSASVAAEYAEFLNQNFWYQFDFWRQIGRLWSDVPFDRSSPSRALERRIALTAEWSFKTVYAKVIAALADLSPPEYRIESVVSRLDASDLAANPTITVIRDLEGGEQLIVTPRYVAFMQIMLDLAARGRDFFEIAGNHIIFVTMLVPPGIEVDLPGREPILSNLIQSRPGWRRMGFEIRVPDLTKTIRSTQAQGMVIEHIYDY